MIIERTEKWQGVDEDIRRMENGLPPVGGWDEWARHQRRVEEPTGTDWRRIGKSDDPTGS